MCVGYSIYSKWILKQHWTNPLLGTSENNYYRKPFVVIQAFFVGIAPLAFAIAFCHPSFWGYLWTVVYSLVVDWLFIGMAISSTCCYVANKNMKHYSPHGVEQEVEWLYAFDVHCNAFFLQFFDNLCVTIFFVASSYRPRYRILYYFQHHVRISNILYAYLTHLGYRALPLLTNAQVFFWYPSVLVAVLCLLYKL